MKVIYKYSTSTIVIKSFYKTRLTMIQVKYNKPISINNVTKIKSVKRKTRYKRELSLLRENNKNIQSLLHGKLQRQQSIWHKNKLSLLHGQLQRQKSIWHKNELSLLKRKLERQQSIWQRKRQSNCLQTSSCPKLERQQSIWHKNKLSLLERKLERQQSIWQRKR